MRQIQLEQITTDKTDPSKFIGLEPYIVLDNQGTVQDEEFKLVGFVKAKTFKVIDVDFQTFFSNPYMAVGKYAVFQGKDNEWYADQHLISDVKVIET